MTKLEFKLLLSNLVVFSLSLFAGSSTVNLVLWEGTSDAERAAFSAELGSFSFPHLRTEPPFFLIHSPRRFIRHVRLLEVKSARVAE